MTLSSGVPQLGYVRSILLYFNYHPTLLYTALIFTITSTKYICIKHTNHKYYMKNVISFYRSTNPAKFDLEFYYQDATEPSCSIFKLVSNFSYEEKSSIQLLCGDDDSPVSN